VPPRTDSSEVTSFGPRIRCVLAHDHVLLRQGLRRLLQDEPDIDVIGEAGNAAECLRNVHDLRPDVLVADALTLGLSPSEAESLVSRESASTKVVFLRTQEGAGALLDALRAASPNSNTHGSNGQEASLQTHPQGSGAALFSQVRALTAREREVLKLLAEGKTVRGAALVLGLSSKTVDAHKFNLMRKLGIHNKAQLVMWAIQRRVVKIPVNF
jgi:two-component system, NarL family, response regulator NreC